MALPESLEVATVVSGTRSLLATVCMAALLWWHERKVRLRDAGQDAEVRLRGLQEQLSADDAMHVTSAFRRECGAARQKYCDTHRTGQLEGEQA